MTSFAVVPAAGLSTRMGRPKLALPLGDSTVIGRVIKSLGTGGVEHVLVVVGPQVPELVPVAKAAGADVCLLPAGTADMRETVERGLRWLEEQYHPDPSNGWMLAPADCPLFSPTTVRRLLNLAASNPAKSIVVPTSSGRRGHPTLFAWRHAAGIQEFSAELGINAYLHTHSAKILEVETDDVGILRDLDTEADYEELRNLLPGRLARFH